MSRNVRHVAWLYFGWEFCFFMGRKSVILGVWAAPGAPETLPKGGGLRPPPFARVSKGPRGRPDPQNDRFPTLKTFSNFIAIPSAAALGILEKGPRFYSGSVRKWRSGLCCLEIHETCWGGLRRFVFEAQSRIFWPPTSTMSSNIKGHHWHCNHTN